MSGDESVNGTGRDPLVPRLPLRFRPASVVHGPAEPVVYSTKAGTPDQFETLLDSVTALADIEPRETYASRGVQTASRRLARLLTARADEGETGGPAGDSQ